MTPRKCISRHLAPSLTPPLCPQEQVRGESVDIQPRGDQQHQLHRSRQPGLGDEPGGQRRARERAGDVRQPRRGPQQPRVQPEPVPASQPEGPLQARLLQIELGLRGEGVAPREQVGRPAVAGAYRCLCGDGGCMGMTWRFT